MKEIRCNGCGREFGQRDYDANIGVRWSHDTESNKAYQAELCCDCLGQMIARYMEEMAMATTHEYKTICAVCGAELDGDPVYQMRVSGNAPKVKAAWDSWMCRDCFDSRAARFAEECTIKPKAVPWINLEMCAWQKDTEDKVNVHD